MAQPHTVQTSHPPSSHPHPCTHRYCNSLEFTRTGRTKSPSLQLHALSHRLLFLLVSTFQQTHRSSHLTYHQLFTHNLAQPLGGGVKPKITVDDASFDPLTYKDKFGVLNVNPNLKKDLDLNTARTPCTRCGRIHRWGPELCTTNTDKDNQTLEPAMTAAENLTRATKKWDLGFHFKSDPRERPKTVRPSPSAGASAAQATDTRIALTSGRGGGVAGRA